MAPSRQGGTLRSAQSDGWGGWWPAPTAMGPVSQALWSAQAMLAPSLYEAMLRGPRRGFHSRLSEAWLRTGKAGAWLQHSKIPPSLRDRLFGVRKPRLRLLSAKPCFVVHANVFAQGCMKHGFIQGRLEHGSSTPRFPHRSAMDPLGVRKPCLRLLFTKPCFVVGAG